MKMRCDSCQRTYDAVRRGERCKNNDIPNGCDGQLFPLHESVPPHIRQSFHDFARNGRWGTCVECPTDGDGRKVPELCAQTDRSDHMLSVTDLALHYDKVLHRVGR